MDGLILSRLQFAANISFHILFPAINIALAWILFYFRWRWLRTRDADWLHTYQLWTKVFALSFALGVVSGITMSFQFGTNWPGFMAKAGNIAGPLLGYEVLTAFFLEAGFLGIMLFGAQRVSERVHLMACLAVAVGTSLSAFWILSLNSWMQTPAGVVWQGGQLHASDWWAIVFNPSFPYRLAHMLLASGLTAAFLIAGLSAWQIRRHGGGRPAQLALRSALVLAAVLVPAQVVVGDLHGLNTLKHQPQKIAAIEGIWTTQRGAPLTVFGLPDEAARETRFAVEIPKAASLILTHELDGELKGLDAFGSDHPPVAPVFIAFRVMVGAGMAMWLAAWLGLWQWRRHLRLNPAARAQDAWQGRLLKALHAMTFIGWLATLAGWYVTEIGRQPFVVSGLIRTADVVTQTPSPTIAMSLAAYLLLYAFLLASYVAVLHRLARKSAQSQPDPVEGPHAMPSPAWSQAFR